MLKYALLATAMTFAVPALAQTTAPAQTTNPGRAPMSGEAATTDNPVANPAQAQSATPAAPASDPSMTTAQTAPASPQAAADATAQPASGSQVAQVVNTEFPTYDKDSNGALNQAEFASWMVALKTASDPATKAESAETKAWINGAFAQADKDKSKSVSKDELTGFLSQGQS